MTLALKAALAALAAGLAMAPAMAELTAPAPPPDLPATLRDFRTQEQLDEMREIKNADGGSGDVESLNIESSPFVPGDDSAGVVRLAYGYVPGIVMGVPDRGMLVVRFFDSAGAPWDIAQTRVENPGLLGRGHRVALGTDGEAAAGRCGIAACRDLERPPRALGVQAAPLAP